MDGMEYHLYRDKNLTITDMVREGMNKLDMGLGPHNMLE